MGNVEFEMVIHFTSLRVLFTRWIESTWNRLRKWKKSEEIKSYINIINKSKNEKKFEAAVMIIYFV